MTSSGIHERELIIFEVYTKLGLHDKLKERWKLINYKPIIQLILF